MIKSKPLFLSELAPVRRALAAWRKTRPYRRAIPEPLWTELAALARTHGVSPVSQALGLDYYTLKRRAAAVSKVPSAAVSPTFVEWKLPSPEGPAACLAQLEDGRGRKLTLRWSAVPGPELLGVVQSFWQATP